MFNEAKKFIELMYRELGKTNRFERLDEIESQIKKYGTYTHTKEELEYGARVAWRNSNRCIGRLFWNNLTVRDLRHIKDEEAFVEEIESHIKDATNDGKIKPMISIFNNEFEIKNEQLLRYAGYETKGEPKSKHLTQFLQTLGWQVPEADFNLLPLVYRKEDNWKYHTYKDGVVTEVEIFHPEYPKLSELKLRWYATPIISNMELEIGGVSYHTAPFNGWYMETEIGVRNFTDSYRYNKLKEIAEAFNLDTKRTDSFWRDRALVEFNYAVYHSFKEKGVSIVDHFTASKQFKLFEQNEQKENRSVTGKWSWLAPPLSPSLVHNYHYGFNDEEKRPNFLYRKKGCPFS